MTFTAQRVFNHPYYQKLRAHGYNVTAAFLGVKRHEYFRKDLAKQIADHKRRSKAAKKGHKTRRLAVSA